MTKRLPVAVWLGCVAAVLAAVSVAGEVDFDPSTFNPAVGEVVTFLVCEPCLGGGGYGYRWDWDGDGRNDEETTSALVDHVFTDAGAVKVTLSVVDAGGWPVSRTKGILVGESPLFGVRKIIPEQGGSLFVLVTLHAREQVVAPAVEERIPRGWSAQPVDLGTAAAYPMGLALVAYWYDSINAGDRWSFSYRLYPSAYGTGTPELSGTATGYLPHVPTGDPGKRVKVDICGDLSAPQ